MKARAVVFIERLLAAVERGVNEEHATARILALQNDLKKLRQSIQAESRAPLPEEAAMGIRKAVRDLGIDRTEAQRAVKAAGPVRTLVRPSSALPKGGGLPLRSPSIFTHRHAKTRGRLGANRHSGTGAKVARPGGNTLTY